MKNTWLKFVGAAVAVVAFAGSASAIPEITFYVDSTEIGTGVNNPVNYSSITDLADITSAPGWLVSYAIGTLQNASLTSPLLDIGSLDVSTTAAAGQTMTIAFIYSGIGPLGAYSTAASGTFTGGMTQTVSAIVGVSQAELLVTLTSGGVGGSASIDDSLTVPDGGTTLTLLGLGLSGCALFARKMRLV